MLGLAELGTWATVFAGLCDDCNVSGLQDALHRCPGLQTGMFAIGLSCIGSGSAGAAVAVGLECGVGWACSWPHWFVCGPTDPGPHRAVCSVFVDVPVKTVFLLLKTPRQGIVGVPLLHGRGDQIWRGRAVDQTWVQRFGQVREQEGGCCGLCGRVPPVTGVWWMTLMRQVDAVEVPVRLRGAPLTLLAWASSGTVPLGTRSLHGGDMLMGHQVPQGVTWLPSAMPRAVFLPCCQWASSDWRFPSRAEAGRANWRYGAMRVSCGWLRSRPVSPHAMPRCFQTDLVGTVYDRVAIEDELDGEDMRTWWQWFNVVAVSLRRLQQRRLRHSPVWWRVDFWDDAIGPVADAERRLGELQAAAMDEVD